MTKWQVQVVIGEDRSAVMSGMRDAFSDEEDMEFKDYKLVEVSDEFGEKLQTTETLLRRRMTKHALLGLTANKVDDPDEFTSEIARSEQPKKMSNIDFDREISFED